MNTSPVESPRCSTSLRWLVWVLYLCAWTAALLTTHPVQLATVVFPETTLRFLAAKLLHVSAYALLAVLSGWLRAPLRYRWLLLAFLPAHALGTEFLQQFVELRTGSWEDVGIDHLGLALGLTLSWRQWRSAD